MWTTDDDRCPPERRLKATAKFCPYSLGDWLRLAKANDVPHVDGSHVADFERHDLLNHEYEGPHQARLDAAYATMLRHVKPDTMMRWDCCASADLKFAMAESRSPSKSERNLLAIDARLLEIAQDFPRILIPVWQRPWLERAAVQAGYPIEYRVFVKNGEIEGISSYYPQRPLTRNDAELEAAEHWTRVLINALEGPFEWPPEHDEALGMQTAILRIENCPTPPGTPDPNGVHFTADFVATTDGMILLEGGPPHFMGAHPCCFNPGAIHGVALAPQPEDDTKGTER